MRVIIAADKFKHSLTSTEVAHHLAKGLLIQKPELTVESVLIADGGEGTVDAAISAGFTPIGATVSGPTGIPTRATIAVRGHEAIIEIAAVSGLPALLDGIPAALTATSFGTGQLIKKALDQGCTRIYLGAGGSACTDGGSGLLVSLGAKLLDSSGDPLPHGGGALADLASVDMTGLDTRLRDVQFVLAGDVDNPLLGTDGAAAVFGPQKGATPDDVALLDACLTRFVEVLGNNIGPQAVSASMQAGAGAAGGIGYATLAILGACFKPGVEVVGQLIGLDRLLQGAALVITGEGSLDEQSLAGKAPMGVSQAAIKAGIRTVAVCGQTTLPAATLTAAGFTRTYALTPIEPDPRRCMAHAGQLLETVGKSIANDVLQVACTNE